MAEGLTPDEALRFAIEHGLVDPSRASVRPLEGGVSNDTLLVADGDRRVVVKRALERLRTDAEWHAPASRALEEARCLRLVAAITPDAVPAVLAEDAASSTIALEAAPASWRDWRDELLAERVDPAVGTVLGRMLGAWHRTTRADQGMIADLDGLDRLETLRLTPFHETVAAAHADLAPTIRDAADRLRTERLCFVHGDFSPKNVLTGSGTWVIDFEVAHRGNPVFDVAFLSTHLLLKTIARPAVADPLRTTLAEFSRAYAAACGPSGQMSGDELRIQAGCLLLSRVDGTSPATYLTGEQRARARDLGRRMISGEESGWPS
jgi:aminoglycoside phosphotransferase (APT) family kinase protein